MESGTVENETVENETVENETVETETSNLQETKTEFFKIIKEFIPDLLHTFPEYKENLHQGLIDILSDTNETDDANEIYEYCKTTFPEHFFNILYQNEEVFDNNIHFLPNINFSTIWKSDVSDKTREIIWKYLQLILFSVIGDVNNEKSFGDSAKLFEAINEEDLKKKLEETLKTMQSVFDCSGNENVNIDSSNINLDNLPNPDDINNHINSMLGGKLGALAREIAEETANEMDIDMEESTSVNDVFTKLFRNPGKLMSMVKNIGSKIEHKIKSGEIKESELIKEAGEMMQRMKSMPGMGDMKSMLSKFGLPTGGKNSKLNMGAFQSHMQQNLRQSKMRERLQQRLAEKQALKEQQMKEQNVVSQQSLSSDNVPVVQNTKFTIGEPAERSKRKSNNDNKKRKRRKRRRNKKKK